ncbi:hypothetical protein BCV69DRAFT_292528 [Microstroma glucosiphilum]|uniref:Uncharacterized protein n=1 Tax=Pseudomicrostroma glucosiphilum TaxID=1684307 RepID=A0A316UEC8_9BASI|nr:hypothetical protein BCV69DRAFT_292528 [Pseudomicrostroma glucosiphilum]PWN23268.1 hypothetical protein BCV69DRAFT_292528 [Pseudomicrostroma glucosiphilum]
MEQTAPAEPDPMALSAVMSDGIQGKRRRNASQEGGVDAFQAVSSSSAPELEEDQGGPKKRIAIEAPRSTFAESISTLESGGSKTSLSGTLPSSDIGMASSSGESMQPLAAMNGMSVSAAIPSASSLPVDAILGTPSGLTTPSPKEEMFEEEAEEIFESPSLVPRIGGWIVPRPSANAQEPRLLVPAGAPEDPDDRPLLSHGGSTSAGSSSFRDRPWIEEVRAREAAEELERIEKEKAAVEAKSRIVEPSPVPVPPCNLTYPPWAGLTMVEARTRIVEALQDRSSTIPSFLKTELEHFVSLASAPLPKKIPRRPLPPLEALPKLNQRPLWAVQLVESADDESNSSNPVSLLLVCSISTRTFDVVAVPPMLAARMHAGEAMSPWWYEQEDGKGKRKRLDDGSFKQDKSPQQEEKATKEGEGIPLTPSMPESEAVQLLQTSLTSMTGERDQLRKANKRLEDRISAEQSTVEALTEQVALARSLYNQASTAAREAVSEATASEEQIEKLTRQLRDGLAAQAERYRLGREQWLEEERQLRDQVRLLKGSAELEQKGELRKRVNDWHAWNLGQEERERLRKQREERARREWEEEQAAELAALREEEEEEQARQSELAALGREAESDSELAQQGTYATSGPFAFDFPPEGASSSSSPPGGLGDLNGQAAATSAMMALQHQEASRLLRQARQQEQAQAQEQGEQDSDERMSLMGVDGHGDSFGSRHGLGSSRRSSSPMGRLVVERRDRPAPDEDELARLALMVHPPSTAGIGGAAQGSTGGSAALDNSSLRLAEEFEMFEDRENRQGMLHLADHSSDADFLRQSGAGLFDAEPEVGATEPQGAQVNGFVEGEEKGEQEGVKVDGQLGGAEGAIEVDVDDYLVSSAGDQGINGTL